MRRSSPTGFRSSPAFVQFTVMRSRELAAEVPTLDLVIANPRFNNRISLRRIMVHMIEETARHAGHADLIRETIDGQLGDHLAPG